MMTRSLLDKLEAMLEVLAESLHGPPLPAERGILLVYPPEEELELRERLPEYLLQVKAPQTTLDVETLPFELLASEGVLADAYRLEHEDAVWLRRYLAEQLPRLLHQRVRDAGQQLGVGGVIVLETTTALFPWVSYADLLQSLPAHFPCRIVIPFPGHGEGAYLHFLDHRDGFNYLARRIE